MADKSKHLQLRHEIILTLALKCVLLTIIWFVWFSTPEERVLDDRKVASQIFSSQTHKEPDHDAITRAR
jgi:hypothetical protein